MSENRDSSINLLTEEQCAIVNDTLSSVNNILITVHKSPDGDAMGSGLALKQYLQSLGKHATLVIPDACPDFLHWLPGYNSVVNYSKKKEEAEDIIKSAELVFCLDYNQLSRVEEMQSSLEASTAPKILIDHHENPTVPTIVSASHPEATSTCELIFKFIKQMSGTDAITHDIAVCIYCGMMTDTGGFTYNSNRCDVYVIISELIKRNIDKDYIYNKVFHNYSAWALKLRSYIILNKLHIVDSLHASYFSVTKKEMHDYHFIKGDLEGVVNIPLTMKGHKLSISLREDRDKPNHVFVSLRSSCGFHCRKVAERFFNGGGHDDAAGGQLYCSMEEAEQTALRAIIAFKDELK